MGNYPAAPKGNTRTVTHGHSAMLALAPRSAEIAETLKPLVPTYCESDEPALRLLSLQLARIEAAGEYLAENGLLDESGVPRPVLRVLSTTENSAARLMDALGMTPTSRAKLGVDLMDQNSKAARLDAFRDAGVRARERLEAMADD
jgi:hypothetical protein